MNGSLLASAINQVHRLLKSSSRNIFSAVIQCTSEACDERIWLSRT